MQAIIDEGLGQPALSALQRLQLILERTKVFCEEHRRAANKSQAQERGKLQRELRGLEEFLGEGVTEGAAVEQALRWRRGWSEAAARAR